MLRLVEVALFLAPFAAFAAWRLLWPRGGPSRLVIGAAAVTLVVLAATLIWLSRQDTLPPDIPYVPPHLQDGVIVPGQGVRR